MIVFTLIVNLTLNTTSEPFVPKYLEPCTRSEPVKVYSRKRPSKRFTTVLSTVTLSMVIKSGAQSQQVQFPNCFISKRRQFGSSLTAVTTNTLNPLFPFSKVQTSCRCQICVISLNCNLCRDLFKGFYPAPWNSNVARRPETVSMVLRNHDDLYVPISGLKTLESFPLYSFPKLWENFADENIKFIRNVN
jgi:hypothetical protein